MPFNPVSVNNRETLWRSHRAVHLDGIPHTNMEASQLHELTKEYWRQPRGEDRLREVADWYLRHLLPEELIYVKEHDRRALAPLVGPPLELLVLMLGHSLEPLLQSIVVYRPKRVFLLYNGRYSRDQSGRGRTRAKLFVQIVDALWNQQGFPWNRLLGPNHHAPPAPPQITCVGPADDALRAFSLLRSKVLPEVNADPTRRAQMLVDITGAKKSMTAGAYLFAGFAGLDVTYVDFDDYDPIHQRPYGMSCRIGRLDSPYETYNLDRWLRLRGLFERSNFDAVCLELEEPANGIIARMQRIGHFRHEELNAIQRLAHAAACYRDWLVGDYRSAWTRWSGVGAEAFPVPVAVERFGPDWIDAASTDRHQQCELLENGPPVDSNSRMTDFGKSIFGDPDRFLCYADDELQRVVRLIDGLGEFRAALLRAAGLSEVMLRFRVIQTHRSGGFDCRFEDLTGQPLADTPDDGQELSHVRLRGVFGVKLLDLLRRSSTLLKPSGRDEPDQWRCIQLRLSRGPDTTPLAEYWQCSDATRVLNPYDLAKLRNKAIHFAIPISREDANAALRSVRASRTELVSGGWIQAADAPNPLNAVPSWLDWEQLCNACGIEGLPLYGDSP